MEILILIGAILMMTIAHLVRVGRWQLFVDVYEKPNKRNLIQSMSFGYLINSFIPFKIGDLFRAWFSGRKMKNGKALGLSTVIVDRYLDVIAVGLIFIGLSVSNIGGKDIKSSAYFYVILMAALIVLTGLVYIFRNLLKKIVRVIASIFNPKIESFILFFCWALIWNFSDIFKKISKIKMIASTIFMWALYVLSYYCFAEYLYLRTEKGSWTDVFLMFFTSNGISSSTLKLGNHTLYTLLYIFLPLILLFVISLFFKRAENQTAEREHVNLLPQLNEEEKLEFLDNYFSNENRDYVENYLTINRDISIIRDYSAGSNATTMLCMDGESTFFRKYAFGVDGDKLYDQIEWIEKYKGMLALPEIKKKDKTDSYCFYDMPYFSQAVGFFEYIHSMPAEKSWDILKRVLETLETSIYKLDECDSDAETISKYVDSKVVKNLDKIKSAGHIKSILNNDTVVINGTEYKNLSYFEKYLDKEYLQAVFANDTYCAIHGDLTIENIVCMTDMDDFYLIDPNTGNIHESPNLDFGKLLQSVHGGYEFLMMTRDVSVEGNKINYMHTKSSAYKTLHQKLHDYMMDAFGPERTKSIYYHEIIHWLRLLPYKIEKDGKRALLFYAGLIMVLNDVADMFEK